MCCLNRVKLARQTEARPWETTAHILLNKKMNKATDFSPGSEITETQHHHPPVGLFVHLREGLSTAADRCVCSQFRRGSHTEVRLGFCGSARQGGRHGSARDVRD